MIRDPIVSASFLYIRRTSSYPVNPCLLCQPAGKQTGTTEGFQRLTGQGSSSAKLGTDILATPGESAQPSDQLVASPGSFGGNQMRPLPLLG